MSDTTDLTKLFLASPYGSSWSVSSNLLITASSNSEKSFIYNSNPVALHSALKVQRESSHINNGERSSSARAAREFSNRVLSPSTSLLSQPFARAVCAGLLKKGRRSK